MEFGIGGELASAFWAILLILAIVGLHKFISTAIRDGITSSRQPVEQPTETENENA